MNDQDQINEEERHEAATETPAFLGCPQHMPTHLPGGFDGAEPAPSDEAKKGLADGVERMRDKLSKIADIALAADAKCVNIEKIGKRWMECSKAICEIRKICGPDLIEKAVFSTGMYYTPGWIVELAKKLEARQKPLDPTAPEMKSQSDIQREEARQKRKIHWICYPTKVDLCAMGRTEQNGKVYEVRISKRGDSKVQDTYGQCKVNGKTVITCSFTGNAWMLKRILTEGMQALVNYKAKKARDSRRNFAKRDAAKAAQEGGAK